MVLRCPSKPGDRLMPAGGGGEQLDAEHRGRGSLQAARCRVGVWQAVAAQHLYDAALTPPRPFPCEAVAWGSGTLSPPTPAYPETF